MRAHRFTGPAVLTLAAVCGSLAIGTSLAAAADATSTSLEADSTTPVWSQSVKLTATVTDTAMAATPLGDVQFKDGTTTIGSSMLAGGKATFSTTAPLDLGTHSITAVYTPSTADFAGSTSDPVVVTVGMADTTTSLSATPNPAVAGQVVSFTATVSPQPPATATPTGQVEIADRFGNSFLGVLDAMGRTGVSPSVAAGTFAVDATYQGDPHFKTSTDSVDMQVAKAATATTLTISPNPAAPGTSISYSAVVDVLPPGDVDPAGTLQFSIDGVPVGAAIGLGNGVIGFAGTLTAPPGNHTYQVVAAYSGDDETSPSSASIAVVVAGPATPAAAASSAPALTSARLSAMTSTLTKALRQRGFGALTSTVQTFTVPGPGLLEQKVYSPAAPKTSTAAAARKPLLIASARHRFAAAGTSTLRLKLTAAGRRAIRHAKSLKLAIVTRFAPTSGKALSVTKRLTVHAKRKRATAAEARLGPP